MKTCPLFGICGGCKYDFAANDYRAQKLHELRELPITSDAIWIAPGNRRRADFAVADGKFGFFMGRSKNIVPVQSCPLCCPEINNILPNIAGLPWSGAGGCLITACDNGIDVAVISTVPYFSTNFKHAAEQLAVLRVSWNNNIVVQHSQPVVSFAGHTVNYPPNAFLQPTVCGETIIRDMVISAARGAQRVADLFCGLGNFTFALDADGFDIAGIGMQRDLFRQPLTVGMLNTYDCVVMDPPRAGAMAQCSELVKSGVSRVIYVSCNPQSWWRDANILTHGGFRMTTLIPVDQFVGSAHWELFSVFDK